MQLPAPTLHYWQTSRAAAVRAMAILSELAGHSEDAARLPSVGTRAPRAPDGGSAPSTLKTASQVDLPRNPAENRDVLQLQPILPSNFLTLAG